MLLKARGVGIHKAAAIVLSLLAMRCVGATATPAQPRIVAIGDLHGDLDNAMATMKLAGIIDNNGAWTAGKTILVQTGDTTDRGPDSAKILDLLKRLTTEAAAAGGRVEPLLGNHEVMNIHGDWRYVDPGDLAWFGGEEARRAAFAPDGKYGSWLRTLDVTTQVGDNVFVHGGVTATFAAQGIDGINKTVHASWADPRAAVFGEGGPLWYRGFVQDDEGVACPALTRALTALGARRMIVGHTTRRDGRIQTRCGGALIVIDIGIADHYGAHLGALEIRDDDARALYPTGIVDLEDPP